uniref:MSP domain-containing protein n=1 Tax=Panagrellus redivivus TaxID=6233 RepID=A0A7E4VXV0_PANRE
MSILTNDHSLYACKFSTSRAKLQYLSNNIYEFRLEQPMTARRVHIHYGSYRRARQPIVYPFYVLISVAPSALNTP